MKTTLAYLLSTGLFSSTVFIILFSINWHVLIDNNSVLQKNNPSTSSIIYIHENEQIIPYSDHSLYYLPHPKSYLSQIIQKKVTPIKSPDPVLSENHSIPITKKELFSEEESEVDAFQILKKDFLDSQLEIFAKIGQIPTKSKIKRNQFAVLKVLNYETGRTEKHTINLEENFKNLHQKAWEPFAAKVIIRNGGWFGVPLIEQNSNQLESQKKILEIIKNHLNWAKFKDGYYQMKVQK